MLYLRCAVGDKFSEFRRRVDIGEDPSKVLDELGLKRYCCRRMLLSGFEIIDYQLPYYEATERRRKDLLGS